MTAGLPAESADAFGALARSLRWGRLAEPQRDGYDVRAMRLLLAQTTSAGRPQPYVRSAPVGTLRVGPLYSVAEREAAELDRFAAARSDDPRIAAGRALLACWPEGEVQTDQLLEALHPAIDPRVPRGTTISSASHSTEDCFGALWATINSPIGLAQAFVHELAHHKLRALGVAEGLARVIVANPADARYPSSLVSFPRPMSAVLHAHYALVHIAALETALLQTSRSRNEHAALERSFARHVALLRVGAATIRRHLVVDAFGVSFMRGLWDWMERTLSRGARHVA